MNITREGSKLSVSLPSGIGYTLPFHYTCNSEHDAAAWHHLLQREDDANCRRQQEQLDDLFRRVARAERQAAAYKGLLRRQKKLASATPRYAAPRPGSPS